MTDQHADDVAATGRCLARYEQEPGYTCRCQDASGHQGKHVGYVVIDDETIDCFWKDSDRGALIDGQADG